MTVEQLDIIITAQTADLQEKLAAVNGALEETLALARQAAAAVSELTGAQVSVAAAGDTDAAKAVTPAAAESAADTGIPAVPPYRRAADISEETPGNMSFEEFAAANVPELERRQTLIGAVSEDRDGGSGARSAPIEIHTTVELDGDRLGEAVAAYNSRMSRITDGFYS